MTHLSVGKRYLPLYIGAMLVALWLKGSFTIEQEWFGDVKIRQQFEIQHYQLKRAIPTISRQTNIETLIIHFSEDDEVLFEQINKIQGVKHLILRGEGVTCDLSALGTVKEIKALSIYNIRDTALSEVLSTLTSLEALTLSQCNLNRFPSNLKAFKQLKTLNLINTGIDLDEHYLALRDLPALSSLDIYKSKLSRLPVELLTIPTLKVMALEKMHLKDDTTGLETLDKVPALEQLYLRSNGLQKMPRCIQQCRRLKVLNVAYNQLYALPDWIANLSQLNDLILDNNAFEKWPQPVQQLSELRILSLSNNYMTHLPPNIAGLDQLKTLDLGENRILSIPDTLDYAFNLEVFVK